MCDIKIIDINPSASRIKFILGDTFLSSYEFWSCTYTDCFILYIIL